MPVLTVNVIVVYELNSSFILSDLKLRLQLCLWKHVTMHQCYLPVVLFCVAIGIIFYVPSKQFHDTLKDICLQEHRWRTQLSHIDLTLFIWIPTDGSTDKTYITLPPIRIFQN